MAGYKTAWTGTLQESDINSYLMTQTVPRFASQAARDSAISSPDQGQMCWTATPNTLWIYESDNIASAQWVRLWTPWTDWTSSISFSSGVTEGDGTWDAVRRYEGGTLHIRAQFTLGSTSSVSSAPQIDMTSDLGSGATHVSAGHAFFRDTSASRWYDGGAINGIGSFVILLQGTDGNIDSTTPFTWASGDLIVADWTVTPYPLDVQ